MLSTSNIIDMELLVGLMQVEAHVGLTIDIKNMFDRRICSGSIHFYVVTILIDMEIGILLILFIVIHKEGMN